MLPLLQVLKILMIKFFNQIYINIFLRQRLKVIAFQIILGQLVQMFFQINIIHSLTHNHLQSRFLILIFEHFSLIIHKLFIITRRLQMQKVFRNLLLNLNWLIVFVEDNQRSHGVFGVFKLLEFNG